MHWATEESRAHGNDRSHYTQMYWTYLMFTQASEVFVKPESLLACMGHSLLPSLPPINNANGGTVGNRLREGESPTSSRPFPLPLSWEEGEKWKEMRGVILNTPACWHHFWHGWKWHQHVTSDVIILQATLPPTGVLLPIDSLMVATLARNVSFSREKSLECQDPLPPSNRD